MKIRNGYVSNSSSSSFLISIFTIKKDFLEELKKMIEPYGEIDLYDNPKLGYNELEAFDGSSVSCNVSENEALVKMYITGDDPCYDEESEEYDYYSVDESYFDPKYFKLIDDCKEKFGCIPETMIGAGYNG